MTMPPESFGGNCLKCAPTSTKSCRYCAAGGCFGTEQTLHTAGHLEPSHKKTLPVTNLGKGNWDIQKGYHLDFIQQL